MLSEHWQSWWDAIVHFEARMPTEHLSDDDRIQLCIDIIDTVVRDAKGRVVGCVIDAEFITPVTIDITVNGPHRIRLMNDFALDIDIPDVSEVQSRE